MIEEFQSRSFRDFTQRYADTYGWFLAPSNKKVLVKLASIGETYLKFIDSKGTSYTANADKGNFFEFIPLEKSLYTFLDRLILVQRVPARQWRRGIHHQNTTIFFVGERMGGGLDVDFEVLEHIFKPNHHKESLERFLEGKTKNVAINAMFGVAGNNLYVYNRVIGTFDKTRLALSDDLFKQEVVDMIRDHKLPWELV